MTDILDHDGKVTSDKKVICNLYRRYKDGNRDYCSHVLVIFETISGDLIVFVRFLLGKVGLDRVIRPRREVDIRYEFGLKIILKDLWKRQSFLQPFLIEFASNN